MTSRVYQLSSRRNKFNADDETYFSHATTRMLTAEQLLDAICAVTGQPEEYSGDACGDAGD
jgi:predicted enzyme involved in methoxymalonyl-ACP biosynthesis